MDLKQCSYEQMKEALFSSSTLFLSLSFFITLLFVFKLKRNSKSKSKHDLNLPPSPLKLPIIGNLHQLGTLPHRSLRDLSLKYGDIMMLQLGQMQSPTLVVSSVDTVMEIMKKHDLTFSNRPQNTAAKILLYGCTDVGFGQYGEDWRQKRKICVLQLLSMKMVQSFRGIREEEVGELVSKLREVTSSSDAPCVNVREMLLRASMNIVCKCVLGRTCAVDRVKDSARKVMIHLAAFTVRDFFPWLGWVDALTGKIKEYKSTSKAMDALFDEVIEEHFNAVKREDERCTSHKDFVDILLQLQHDEKLGMHLNRSDMKALLTDMFVAGTDTTSTALEWALSELARNPIVMKKVQEDVRRVVGHKSIVEENDVNQMPYLKCVVKETLRLHPPTSLLPPRETMSSVKLRGYDIPAKTMVYVNAWAMQRDPKFWESPEEFLPERFEKSQVDFIGKDSQFLPFGFGRRGCPGMNFATALVEYMLANLLYWFDWKMPETVTDIDMDEVYGLVTSKKVALHLKPIVFSF